jgi:hypothetical protein
MSSPEGGKTLGRRCLACLLVALLPQAGCGSGEREVPVVSKSGAGDGVSTDYPLGKPAPRKLTGKAAKFAPPIDVPTGPGNK